VANRIISVEIQDADSNVIGGTAIGAAQTATNTFKYYGGIGLAENTGALARSSFSLPWTYLQPGWKLVDATQGLQVGDQFSVIKAIVERVSVGPDGSPIGETGLPYTQRDRPLVRTLEGG